MCFNIFQCTVILTILYVTKLLYVLEEKGGNLKVKLSLSYRAASAHPGLASEMFDSDPSGFHGERAPFLLCPCSWRSSRVCASLHDSNVLGNAAGVTCTATRSACTGKCPQLMMHCCHTAAGWSESWGPQHSVDDTSTNFHSRLFPPLLIPSFL